MWSGRFSNVQGLGAVPSSGEMMFLRMAAHPRRAFASHSGTLVSSQRHPKRDRRSMRSHMFIVHTGNPDPGPVVCVLASELEGPFVLPGPPSVPVAPGTAPRRGSPRRELFTVCTTGSDSGRQRLTVTLTRSSLRLSQLWLRRSLVIMQPARRRARRGRPFYY